MEEVDVIIVGGGPAGMEAALVLARARKRVVVLDGEQPRHGVADGVHNFLSREGIDPWELRRVARAQILELPTARFEEAWVDRLEADEQGVTAHTTDGAAIRGRYALLAVGVRDQHPSWPGFAEIWGKSAHHCPFCHGWESRDQALGYVAPDSESAHHAFMLRGWSKDIVVFSDGAAIDEPTQAALKEASVPLHTAKIRALRQRGGQLEAVELEDGQIIKRQGLFVRPNQAPVALVQRLGLEMDGVYVKVDAFQKTSRPRILSAGDSSTMMQSVVNAVAQGMMAAAMITRELNMVGH